jgi:hypothetical protein
LIRNELTALDKGLQMARRKAIYLELYPETRAGVAGAHASNKAQGNLNNANDIVSFASDTADKTKTSKRTVERNVEIGETLSGKNLNLTIRENGALAIHRYLCYFVLHLTALDLICLLSTSANKAALPLLQYRLTY